MFEAPGKPAVPEKPSELRQKAERAAAVATAATAGANTVEGAPVGVAVAVTVTDTDGASADDTTAPTTRSAAKRVRQMGPGDSVPAGTPVLATKPAPPAKPAHLHSKGACSPPAQSKAEKRAAATGAPSPNRQRKAKVFKAEGNAPSSLNVDYTPTPTTKGSLSKVQEKAAPTNPKRSNPQRPGRHHKYSNWRCFLFTMLALYSGLGTWTCAAFLGIAVSDVNRVFSTFVMFMHHSLEREQPKVSSKRSRSRMPQHWKDILKTNRVPACVHCPMHMCGTHALPLMW